MPPPLTRRNSTLLILAAAAGAAGAEIQRRDNLVLAGLSSLLQTSLSVENSITFLCIKPTNKSQKV